MGRRRGKKHTKQAMYVCTLSRSGLSCLYFFDDGVLLLPENRNRCHVHVWLKVDHKLSTRTPNEESNLSLLIIEGRRGNQSWFSLSIVRGGSSSATECPLPQKRDGSALGSGRVTIHNTPIYGEKYRHVVGGSRGKQSVCVLTTSCT